MLKRRFGAVFVMIGAVLVLSALLLFLHNKRESDHAGEAASSALSTLREAMAVAQDPLTGDRETVNPTAPAEETVPETAVPEPTALSPVEIDGNYYIGYISIPGFELELPVMSDWSMAQLQIAPCLQYGSPLEDDAVIAGHNYKNHFLPLHDIEEGELVRFVDMSGYVIEYEVTKTKIIPPTSVDEVVNSEHDLILYTCTTGGRSRVIVCCDRIGVDAG